MRSIKRIINIKKLISIALIILTVYITFLYIKWGIVEAFKHYPGFDESVNLVLISNFARYGKYEMRFDYYNSPKLFNPFVSIGPPFIVILAAFIKLLGYHFYIVGLLIFFLVSIPLIFSFIYLLNSLIIPKLTTLNRIVIGIFSFLFLITNRLFYDSRPTGGSFTHGPIGEPFSLLSIILSSLCMLFGIKKRKLVFLYISGVLAALAFETKNISILLFVSQTFILITLLLFLYIKNAKDTFKEFFRKGFIFLVLGFVTLTGLVWVWGRSHFTTKEYRQYSCWKKVVFINKGSGISNLIKPSLSQFENNLNASATELIHFFSDDIGDRWGINNKVFVIAFFSLMYFFILKRQWNKGKLLYNLTEKVNFIKVSYLVTELTLGLTFILGSLWYFYISDLHWIRHYYVFIFIGFLVFIIVLVENIHKRIFNIFFVGLLLYLLIFFLPKSPLGGSYHLREILIYKTEEGEQKFISFYKPLSNKKTYICGLFNAQPATFLSGINFYNNILQDAENVYPKCDSIPTRKIRDDLKPPFIYINLASETYYSECRLFFEKNKERFKKIFDYGNGVFEFN